MQVEAPARPHGTQEPGFWELDTRERVRRWVLREEIGTLVTGRPDPPRAPLAWISGSGGQPVNVCCVAHGPSLADKGCDRPRLNCMRSRLSLFSEPPQESSRGPATCLQTAPVGPSRTPASVKRPRKVHGRQEPLRSALIPSTAYGPSKRNIVFTLEGTVGTAQTEPFFAGRRS